MKLIEYVGITERGDAGIDFSWQHRLLDVNILITKRLSKEFNIRII